MSRMSASAHRAIPSPEPVRLAAHAVSRRRGEIGIRLALGGQPSGIVTLTLTRIGALVTAGTLIGVVVAAWLSRYIAPLLYGVEPRDPVTLAVAAATLVAVATLAAWIPASRAARVDPAEVLRKA